MPIEIDNRGNWVVDVNKIKISPDAVANNTRTFRADTNIIPQSEENLNPDTKLYQLKGLSKQKKVRQGSFDYSTKAIELFKTADYSTLPHELAHFWLDNMWGYYRSGKVSEAFK